MSERRGNPIFKHNSRCAQRLAMATLINCAARSQQAAKAKWVKLSAAL
jgi:hypothetical protein